MNHLNLVNKNNHIAPNYILKENEKYIDIYVSPDQEVCIVGRYDPNYIGWCSLTTISDTSTNAAIFDYIVNHEFSFVSNENRVLGKKYDEIKKWHFFRITKTQYNGETRYHSHAIPSLFSTGTSFASILGGFYKKEKSKSEYRIISRTYYLAILEEYKKTLECDDDDNWYYLVMEPLIELLRGESYMKLCPDQEVRELYLKCLDICDWLYSRYMTAVR